MDKRKIFMVDDDEMILEYLIAALDVAGYAPVAASTATEALSKLKTSGDAFPVILSDITMPGIDGLELLKILKKEYPETMVIMLTGNTTMDTAIQALNEGAFAFLTKPVNIGELKSTIKNAFERYDLSQENKRLAEELDKAKDSLENVVQNLVHVVIATDTAGIIKKTNKAVESFLGYAEQELTGKEIGTVFSDEFKGKAFNELANAGHAKDFPVVFVSKGRKAINVLFNGAVMKDKDGQTVGLMGSAQIKSK